MSLLLPRALLGLLALPLILVLHLLRHRRQQQSISSLQLWRGLQREGRGRLPRTVPLSLMLLLQLLVAAAITFALARPVHSFLPRQPRQTIFILDTTTSMAATDAASNLNPLQEVRRFDAARQVIQADLEAMVKGDTVTVIGLTAHPEVVLTTDAEQKNQALLALRQLRVGATGLDLPQALTLASGLVDLDQQSQIIVLTDGNFTLDLLSLPPMRAPVSWRFIPSPSGIDAGTPETASNQALLNVSAYTLPDGRQRLFARVVNFSDVPVARTLRVSADAGAPIETTVQIGPQEEVARTWTLPAGGTRGAVEIREPDVLALDNRAELFLRRTAQHRVLLLSEAPELLARALEAQPGVELTIAPPETTRHDLADFDLTVFDGLPFSLTAWPAGNLLIVNPPLGHSLLPARNFSRNLRPDAEAVSEWLDGVDLSGVFFGRVPQIELPAWAQVDLMALPPSLGADGEGQPLVFHGSVEHSRLVVWAFDLAQSNLPARLALPLLTANTLSGLLSSSTPAIVPLGESVPIPEDSSVESPDGSVFAPSASDGNDQQRSLFAQTQQPGLHAVRASSGAPLSGFAVHAGSALESNLSRRFDPAAFDLASAPAGPTAEPQVEQRELWPWLIGLVLTVIIVEGWLAWRI